MRADTRPNPVGHALPHESAALHVSGAAHYLDDLPELAGTLHAAIGQAPCAHGRLRALQLDAVRAAPGVRAVLTAADIPGENNCGPILHDDPLLAAEEVQFYGQPLFVVAADSREQARQAARLAQIDIEPLPALLDIDSAVATSASPIGPDTAAKVICPAAPMPTSA